MVKKDKTELAYKHMLRYKSITNMQAVAKHDNYRLSSSIQGLRKKGICIDMVMITVKKTGVRYGKYYLTFK